MIESIFDAPHFATDEELHTLHSSFKDRADLEQNGPQSDDNRLLYIWELYRLRGDAAGMAAAEARLQDPSYFDEVRYRDAVENLDIFLLTEPVPEAEMPFIESIFDAPHLADDAEMHAVFGMFKDRADYLQNGPKTRCDKLLSLSSLYLHRNDRVGMAVVSARLKELTRLSGGMIGA